MNANMTVYPEIDEQQETQADIIKEGLDRKGMTAWQLSKELGLKSSSFIYNIMANRTHMAKPETVHHLADILDVDADRMYLAAGKIPPDVYETVLEHPQLIQVVRNLRSRLEGQG